MGVKGILDVFLGNKGDGYLNWNDSSFDLLLKEEFNCLRLVCRDFYFIFDLDEKTHVFVCTM